MKKPCPPRLEPRSWPQQAERGALSPRKLSFFLLTPWVALDRGWRHSCGGHQPGGGGTRPAHLPLVPMQQGRPLMVQSMCRKPVWLLLACSVQICGGHKSEGGPSDGRPSLLPSQTTFYPGLLTQGHSLTGHLVMSSGQMWAPLEAGSSQVLEAEIRFGKMMG